MYHHGVVSCDRFLVPWHKTLLAFLVTVFFSFSRCRSRGILCLSGGGDGRAEGGIFVLDYLLLRPRVYTTPFNCSGIISAVGDIPIKTAVVHVTAAYLLKHWWKER